MGVPPPNLRLNCASDVDQRHAGRIRWIEPCARKVWTLPWQPSDELQAFAARRSFIRAPGVWECAHREGGRGTEIQPVYSKTTPLCAKL